LICTLVNLAIYPSEVVPRPDLY